jgi:hypothetical protein
MVYCAQGMTLIAKDKTTTIDPAIQLQWHRHLVEHYRGNHQMSCLEVLWYASGFNSIEAESIGQRQPAPNSNQIK